MATNYYYNCCYYYYYYVLGGVAAQTPKLLCRAVTNCKNLSIFASQDSGLSHFRVRGTPRVIHPQKNTQTEIAVAETTTNT
eukprot:11204462-Lingulodinium_polyedra.AAC.1